MTDFHTCTPLFNCCLLDLCGLVLAIWIIVYIRFTFLFSRTHTYNGCIILITSVLIACLGMLLTNTTFKIRTKLAKLNISPSRLYLASSVHIPSSVNNIRNMVPTIQLSPRSSPIIKGYTKPFKYIQKTCILMYLSAMLRGFSVAYIYVIKLPLHHL